jgi:hypothetical protein
MVENAADTRRESAHGRVRLALHVDKHFVRLEILRAHTPAASQCSFQQWFEE